MPRRDREYDGTPLHYAAFNGHEAVVRLLLEKGAAIDAKGAAIDAKGAAIDAKGAAIVAKGEYNGTPLHHAAKTGHEAVVRLLLEKGAAIEAKDRDDWTPLHHAALNGHKAVVRLLLEKGASYATRAAIGAKVK
ncbi:hypothetical protein NEMBOFW57_009504 [Staphylotrichum longicolle]|uniref:Ankyrin repeat protein n=1 Tax=Staphylotrichum longicolle TaxID=669026 RepID=A0AAD4EPI3_9PEZI|nr:hypothetical protein NEMBOFW57_009504 [Staphylotrichum longicolle]